MIFLNDSFNHVTFFVQSLKMFNFLGNAGHFDGDVSPLRYLEMAAEWFSTAIKLSPEKADLHFQLGQVFEEQHYVQDLYGIKPLVSFLVIFWC